MCGTYSITCPGVWLCSNGYLEATIKTLGYFFKTGAMEPTFPVLCHDRFTMEGYFKSVNCMSELEKTLAAESVEITLWQNGRRLAHFLGKLADVMHTPLPKFSCFHNVNVQILMKPSPSFPGIIAPKIEISAKAGVQDRSCLGSSYAGSCTRCSKNGLITPTLEREISIRLATTNIEEHKRHQRPVCHTKNLNYCWQRGKSLTSSASTDSDRMLHQNGSRTVSATSSHLTCNSYPFSVTDSSQASGSKCNHSTRGVSAAYEHQQQCDICQSYRKAFNSGECQPHLNKIF